VQTVLVARAVGVTEYGVYGLLVGTVGLAASVAGLQMGLTATVFVARHRLHEKAKAAFAIRFAIRFALGVGAVLLFASLPCAELIARWLIGNPDAAPAVAAACVLTVLALVSGVQEGVVQGFEDFRTVALIRLAAAAATVVPIYPAGVAFGLPGVLTTVVSGALLKSWLLRRSQTRNERSAGLPARGDGIDVRSMLWGFSVPSMLASLLTGFVGWWGTVALSRAPAGFEGVAIATTGIQWRGPILVVASAVSTVAIPMLSRQHAQGDRVAARALQRLLMLWNGGGAALVAVLVALLSRPILSVYGPEFAGGAVVFGTLVVSSVPQVVAGLYLQQLVAQGRMWHQLWMYLWLVVPMAVGYLLAIPRWGVAGFSVTTLIAWSVLAAALALLRREPLGRESATPLARVAPS
jgi:O-antigen/teichoic acid export membrane protein